MQATVLYYSHKGKTAKYAREIAMYLWSKGLDVSLSAITDYSPEKLSNADLLFLGCWTSGWFIVHQHPHSKWKKAARALTDVGLPKSVSLFTTYKFRTGSMFNNMRRVLHLSPQDIHNKLASKTGLLTDDDRKAIDRLIEQEKNKQKVTS